MWWYERLIPVAIQVLVSDPIELEKIRERESDIIKERIRKILGSGANVVLTTKGIDDMALKYFVEAGVIAARRVPKDDLRYFGFTFLSKLCTRPMSQQAKQCHDHLIDTACRRIAKATGGSVILTLADMDGNETFDATMLGTAEEVATFADTHLQILLPLA